MDRAFRAIVPQYTVFHENERVELENQLATASSSTTRLDERRGADVNDGGGGRKRARNSNVESELSGLYTKFIYRSRCPSSACCNAWPF